MTAEYKPATPPQTIDPAIARFLSDELYRIAQALEDLRKRIEALEP